jgi:hypothetical protein
MSKDKNGKISMTKVTLRPRVKFSGNKQADYDKCYWGGLVRLYELENRLPLICRELISLERYRGIRRLRQEVS